ncbi:MAG TPA: universal stress protein [Syntrophales bacterium]|nr:universal stress protein [Syntrophales bacterium]HPQ44129.1 universal stress protein [Syntrophales bacterium]
MFRKILYPTDFSDVAHKALDFVECLKDAGAQEVIIVHIIEKGNFDAIARYATKDILEIEKDLENRAAAEIKPVEERLKQKGFKVKVIIKKAVPYLGILEVEKKEKVSLIVVGSHGTSNIAEMLIGSVAQRIVRRAKTPVLVIR